MNKLATNRNYWYIVSLVALIPGTIALILWGLNLGIDFTGGTIWELQFEESIESEQIQSVLVANGYTDSVVQISSEGELTDNVAIIRMEELPQLAPEKETMEEAFAEEMGPFEELQISTVGSSVSSDISQKAIIAIAAASVGILLYIAFAFRNTQNPLLYGLCAIAGMLHDVLLVLGFLRSSASFSTSR